MNEPISNALWGRLSPAVILDNCDRLTDFQVWPLASKMDTRAWMSNFSEDEKAFAAHLLSKFMYFSNAITDQLFGSAFHNLCNITRIAPSTLSAQRANWRGFFDKALFTYVEGEVPNPTDSGTLFARKMRQVVGVKEEHVVAPADALDALVGGHTGAIIFVDDFVGSGNQFRDTWHRAYGLRNGQQLSFEQFARVRPLQQFYYVVAMSTERGLDRIESQFPSVRVSAGNVLSEIYNALDPHSILWPPEMRTAGQTFIETASKRAGIPDTKGGNDDWRGFNKLGLTLAFEHSTPDATLPLFYWPNNGWRPLLRRS